MKVINRRAFVKGIGLSAAAVAVLPAVVAAKETLKPFRPRFAYVGSRTTKERKARGKGIEVYRIGQNESEWEHIQRLDGLTNPSFLVTDHERRFLYTVHGDQSEISSFAIDAESGKLRKIATASTRGKNPVHLVIHPGSQTMLVANYATGSLVTIPISTDGALGEAGNPLLLPGEAPGLGAAAHARKFRPGTMPSQAGSQVRSRTSRTRMARSSNEKGFDRR
jgi:6-phosphogluconolactonase (cycloisomerase 2 family)